MAKGKKKKKQGSGWHKNKAGTDSPVKAKKYLGQHFLKDESIAQQIAGTLSFNGYRQVLEIGPGTGVLTRHLLQHDIDLVAMELDRESIVYLNQSFPLEYPDAFRRSGSFHLLEADFLRYDLHQLYGDQPFAITGNFPYNISTQIVFKLLEYRDQIPEFSGMFQKEVAQRICSKAGSKIYGILSVLVQAYYEASYLFTVRPEVFEPPPKVESGVLKLVRKPDQQLEYDEKLFFKVVKTAFNQRRKTLRNSLKVFELSDDLRSDRLFDMRPEQLGVDGFINLTQQITEDLNL
jgi:16S rRNA (adenine1518-N6/adenine1519-N6)-dimethyltransferase